MKTKFTKVKDRRGVPIRGLWQRNGAFYGQLNVGGKQTKIPLKCEFASQASDKVLAMRKEIKLGKFKPKVIAPTLADYRETYLANSHKSPKTMQGEGYFLKDWVSFLPEGIKLDQIKPTHILQYRTQQLAEGLSPRTANLRLVVLKNLFKLAKTEGLVDSFPMDEIIQLKYNAPEKPLLSPEDMEKALAVAIECCPRSGPAFVDYLKLLTFSGMRKTECLSLRWEHIDFEKKMIAIPGELTKNGKPKYINFNEQLGTLLKEMKDKTKSDWLFPSPRTGSHVLDFKITLDKVRKKSGVYLTSHLFRHYFISKCVMQGLDYMTIAKWVGHRDGGILIGKVYGHLNAKHLVDSADSLKNL